MMLSQSTVREVVLNAEGARAVLRGLSHNLTDAEVKRLVNRLSMVSFLADETGPYARLEPGVVCRGGEREICLSWDEVAFDTLNDACEW
jgi:hypothetical protein